MDAKLMNAMLDLDEYHWWYRGRREIIGGELRRLTLPADARVLDAGCGSGRTLVELSRLGHVSGIEPNPDAVAVARSRGPFDVRIGRLEQLPFTEATFDLITCLDVIEHTPDDILALRELRRVSRPEAHLVLTVPAYQALWSRHDIANHHYRRYSRRSLARAAAAAGWELERITSFNSLLFVPAALVRLAERNLSLRSGYVTDLQLGRRWLNRILELPMQAEARWLAGGRTLPAGLSLLALARNPASGTPASEPLATGAVRV